MSDKNPQCAICPVEWEKRYCRTHSGKAWKNCPSLIHTKLLEQAREELRRNPDICEIARQSSIQEGEGYGNRDKGYRYPHPIKPRLEEVIEFAGRMNYTRLGLIFCVGLRKEAAMVHNLFEDRGFDVLSIVCKAGSVYKDEIGITRNQQVDRTADRETMCNPILQALVANHHEVEFNVLLGLCVGHDSLFIKYAKAPITVLAVKDRLLAHNPMAAVYQCDHYYRYLKNPVKKSTAVD